jgi:hypothetical protein
MFDDPTLQLSVQPFLDRHRFQPHFRHAHAHFATDRALQVGG